MVLVGIMNPNTIWFKWKKIVRDGGHNCPITDYTTCQGCIFRLTCSHPELTEDHVLTSASVKIFRTATRNAVNKSVWRKKDCSWPPLNKYAMNIWLSSLRIRAHLSWRTGKHLHVLHVLRTYFTCSYPGYQDTTTYAALMGKIKSLLAWKCHLVETIVVVISSNDSGDYIFHNCLHLWADYQSY